MSKEREQKKGGNKPPSIANNTPKNGVLQQRYNYIPIDYIKARIIGLNKEHFLNNGTLIFTPVFEEKTTDTVKYWYNDYNNLKTKVYETGGIYIAGSLHKFSNLGLHNHNQYNESAFNETIEELKRVYGIDTKHLQIIQIEYGVNLPPPIPTNEILNNLLQHKNKDFEQKISSEFGKYYQCQHSNYILKVYNKSLQYGCNDEILRIEIKQTNWSEYRKQGLHSLHDFNEYNKVDLLNNLLQKWNEIIFYDPTNTNIDKWSKYSNINFWRELRTKSHTTQKKHRDRLKLINSKFGLNIQIQISNLIIESVNNSQGLRNYNLVKNQRYCRLTGVNISMQRIDSFLLSHGGLNYLLQNDKQTFDKIANMFLTQKWFTSSIETQIKEIAHNIRAKYNYRELKYLGSQLTMFNIYGGKELQVYI
nr:hypothetical protein [uncultured Brumimicrobium sp.]